MSRISNSTSGGESGEDDDSEDEDEEVMYAEFQNFPVQVTLLERAEGTLDELLDDEEDDPSLEETRDVRWAAWLWQIIAALSTAQHYYGFVHNDLHTNNIMWNTCDADFLYYRVHSKGKVPWIAKVPTYGRLMKIIDFGRASFTLPEPAGFFISDAFYPGNDAGEQYNCEPFYDEADGPRVEPNPSFDLCRLAVSLLESLYPERPEAEKPVKIMSREGTKIYTETISPVYNMLWDWLQDDNGKNVLRKPDGEERYPDFDLYKAISAEVHSAVPCRQLNRPLFSSYRCTEAPEGAPVYDLHID
jgi:serine/threonine protein kinase